MKINSVNFNGLWEKGKCKQIGETYGLKSIPIVRQEIIYHPFSDESKKQIKTQLAMYRETVLTYVYNSDKTGFKNSIIAHFYPVLGTRLPFPSKNHKELPDMSVTPFGLYTKNL